ncbi:MAG: DUF2281 domain-containing protein [Bacteroidota bacterium]
MSEDILLRKIRLLPDTLKKEADNLTDFLVKKHGLAEKKKTPKFGSHPGVFKIAPVFDEPREEFKEYM